MCTVKKQLGTSMVEFLIVLPMLLFTGTGIMQFGLVYHAKSILNYATFEAARAGAVNNGQIEVMRKELGYRMAPVFGGDGSLDKGAKAMARSLVSVNDVSTTKIKILNPTPVSFTSHAKLKDVTDRHGEVRKGEWVIPNSHLRFAPTDIQADGLSLQDANLLKIEVTYGYQMRMPFLDMKVPGVSWIMRNLWIHTDRDNWMYYVRGLLPIKSTATVRMQSDSWKTQEQPIADRAFDAAYNWIQEKLEGEELAGEPNNLVDCTTQSTDTDATGTNSEIDPLIQPNNTQPSVLDFGLTTDQGNMSPAINPNEPQRCESIVDPKGPGGETGSGC